MPPRALPATSSPKCRSGAMRTSSDPAVFARKIDAAADHAVDSFIFDWYWYNDGPFLNGALERGFLRAANNHRLRFALMWANHDWVDIFPARTGVTPALHYPGAVTAQTFEQLTDHIVEHYFSHPSYLTVDGCPYFSVYELFRLVEGLGGVDTTRSALERFRRKTVDAGFRDLHLNGVVWGIQLLPGEQSVRDPRELLEVLGFTSVTSYVWVHHVPFSSFPSSSYSEAGAAMAHYWENAADAFGLPYYPNVTMGWDSSPRTDQQQPFVAATYPFTPTLAGNTPDAFRDALIAARKFLQHQPVTHRILTINAWNEWTEGSYLEPDVIHGMKYLEAIRDIFGNFDPRSDR